MDLVEIRKKAKKNKKASPAKAAPEKRPAQEMPQEEQGARESDTMPLAEPTVAVDPVGLEEPIVDPGDDVVEDSCPSTDALEELFRGQADLTLATEESYLQALQGTRSEIDQETTRWLSFALANEEYSVNIEQVREIIKPRDITDIPRVPGYLLGVISLRGIVIPVIDLRQRLNLGQVEQDEKTRIIVCEQADRIAGLLVDSITQVVNIGDEDIEPPPAILSGLDREMVEGVGRIQGQMIILLDLQQVLDMEMN